MFQNQERWIERDRACQVRPNPNVGWKRGDLTIHPLRIDPDLESQRSRARSRIRRRRINLQCERHREVLQQRGSVEQDGPWAYDAEPIERGEPFIAVRDRARAVAEHRDLPFIRHRRTGDEVDEHFSRTRVEAADRDALTSRNCQILHPERPQ